MTHEHSTCISHKLVFIKTDTNFQTVCPTDSGFFFLADLGNFPCVNHGLKFFHFVNIIMIPLKTKPCIQYSTILTKQNCVCICLVELQYWILRYLSGSLSISCPNVLKKMFCSIINIIYSKTQILSDLLLQEFGRSTRKERVKRKVYLVKGLYPNLERFL